MNKCIKIRIKDCIVLSYKNNINKIKDEYRLDNYKQILRDLRHQSWLACNKSMVDFYIFMLENMEYKNNNGIYIDEKKRFGKTYNAVIENKMNTIMTIHNSGNVGATRKFVETRFKTDIKEILRGSISLSNFKLNNPIHIHNKNYKVYQGNKSWEINCSLFNRNYQKENNISQVRFKLDNLNGSQRATLNKIMSGEYKQGTAQLQEKNGYWYITLSFSFESEKKALDTNRILGIDLGIVKVATMSIYDKNEENWDRVNWKDTIIDGKELIHFRQKVEARKRDLLIAGKWKGDGSCGHGYKTRTKSANQIGDKVANFRDTYNHKISKYIIDFAIKNNCGTIQMEDLSGFSGEQSESFLKNWSYYDLQTKVKYKAESVGIKVIFINPKYTSKRCSHCGCIHEDNRNCKENQGKFECVVCGTKMNADVNASRNISLPNIEQIIVEWCNKNNIKYSKVA